MIRAGDFLILLYVFQLSCKNLACKYEDMVYCQSLIGVFFVFYFPITTSSHMHLFLYCCILNLVAKDSLSSLDLV